MEILLLAILVALVADHIKGVETDWRALGIIAAVILGGAMLLMITVGSKAQEPTPHEAHLKACSTRKGHPDCRDVWGP